MRGEKKEGAWQRLIARMKENKRFEAAVYLALLLLSAAVYMLFSSLPPSLLGTSADGSDAVALELEEALCCMRGVGEAKVMVTRAEENGAIRGVIVVARGAKDVAVRLRIQNAVCTVLGVEAGRVEIFEMNNNEEE